MSVQIKLGSVRGGNGCGISDVEVVAILVEVIIVVMVVISIIGVGDECQGGDIRSSSSGSDCSSYISNGCSKL